MSVIPITLKLNRGVKEQCRWTEKVKETETRKHTHAHNHDNTDKETDNKENTPQAHTEHNLLPAAADARKKCAHVALVNQEQKSTKRS